mmetsp:Transcript_18001/g.34819  ORF Transcript_18001/g.34819 Transcript_18001/m.34819 type:complete len:338 (-) Transcript_18001:37-1050(-)
MGMKQLNEQTLPENYVARIWTWHLLSYPDISHVVTHNGSVVAYVLGFAEGHLNTTRRGHITSLAVSPKYRRLGLASILMRLALHEMKRAYNCSMCKLHVRKNTNEGAARLYLDDLRFRVSNISRAYYVDGEDAFEMEKDIDSFLDEENRSMASPPPPLSSSAGGSGESRNTKDSLSGAAAENTNGSGSGPGGYTAVANRSRVGELGSEARNTKGCAGSDARSTEGAAGQSTRSESEQARMTEDLRQLHLDGSGSPEKRRDWRVHLRTQYDVRWREYRKLPIGPLTVLKHAHIADIMDLAQKGDLRALGYSMETSRGYLNLMPIGNITGPVRTQKEFL